MLQVVNKYFSKSFHLQISNKTFSNCSNANTSTFLAQYTIFHHNTVSNYIHFRYAK